MPGQLLEGRLSPVLAALPGILVAPWRDAFLSWWLASDRNSKLFRQNGRMFVVWNQTGQRPGIAGSGGELEWGARTPLPLTPSPLCVGALGHERLRFMSTRDCRSFPVPFLKLQGRPLIGLVWGMCALLWAWGSRPVVSSTHGTTWIERSPPERGTRQTAICVPHMSNAHGWYVEQTGAPVADARICRNPGQSGQRLGSVTLVGFSGPVFSLLCLLAADRAFEELLFGCKAVLAGITPAPGRSSFPRESLLPKQWQETEGPSRLRVTVPASRPGSSVTCSLSGSLLARLAFSGL